MENAFTVQLFDILVYLVPGAIAGAGVWLLFHGVFRSMGLAADHRVGVVVLLMFAFFTGVLLHATAESAWSLYQRLRGLRYIEATAGEFRDIGLVRDSVRASLRVEPLNDGDVYRYAETVVLERTQHQSASVSRFIALSVFCRNSMLAVLVLAAGLLARFKSGRPLRSLVRSGGLIQLGVTLVALIALETLLYRGMNSYSSAAINKVLRTYVVLQSSGGSNQQTGQPGR